MITEKEKRKRKRKEKERTEQISLFEEFVDLISVFLQTRTKEYQQEIFQFSQSRKDITELIGFPGIIEQIV